MTGFKPLISVIGSNCSTNCATIERDYFVVCAVLFCIFYFLELSNHRELSSVTRFQTSKMPNFPLKVTKKQPRQFLLSKQLGATKYLGYFCKKIYHQELLKSPNLITLELSNLNGSGCFSDFPLGPQTGLNVETYPFIEQDEDDLVSRKPRCEPLQFPDRFVDIFLDVGQAFHFVDLSPDVFRKAGHVLVDQVGLWQLHIQKLFNKMLSVHMEYRCTPDCSHIHPGLLGQGRFKPSLWPVFFLLRSSDCILLVRVHGHW